MRTLWHPCVRLQSSYENVSVHNEIPFFAGCAALLMPAAGGCFADNGLKKAGQHRPPASRDQRESSDYPN